jgi:hypothetical protein
MDLCTNINPDGRRKDSLTELRAKLARQIEIQKEAIRQLEKAYENTYKSERCILTSNNFRFLSE